MPQGSGEKKGENLMDRIRDDRVRRPAARREADRDDRVTSRQKADSPEAQQIRQLATRVAQLEGEAGSRDPRPTTRPTYRHDRSETTEAGHKDSPEAQQIRQLATRVAQLESGGDDSPVASPGNGDSVASEGNGEQPAAAAAVEAPELESFPYLEADAYKEMPDGIVGVGHHMYTHAMLMPDGTLVANTNTYCTNDQFGFTGGVQVLLTDSNGIMVGTTGIHSFGVDGRWIWWNPHNRVDQWTEYFPADVTQSAQGLNIVHMRTPRNRLLEIANEIIAAVGTIFEYYDRACDLYPDLCE
jgi:hypothetical protein